MLCIVLCPMPANDQTSKLNLDLSTAVFAALEDIDLVFFDSTAVFEQINSSQAVIENFQDLDRSATEVKIKLELKEDGEFHVKQTPIVFYLGWKINSARNLEFFLKSTSLERSTQSMQYTLSYFDNDHVKQVYNSGSGWSKLSVIEYKEGDGIRKGTMAITFITDDDPTNRSILCGPYNELAFVGNVMVQVRSVS